MAVHPRQERSIFTYRNSWKARSGRLEATCVRERLAIGGPYFH